MSRPINVTNDTDTRANALLVSFGETVFTAGGTITPTQGIFSLERSSDGKTRKFVTASGALEVLRRLTKKSVN